MVSCQISTFKRLCFLLQFTCLLPITVNDRYKKKGIKQIFYAYGTYKFITNTNLPKFSPRTFIETNIVSINGSIFPFLSSFFFILHLFFSCVCVLYGFNVNLYKGRQIPVQFSRVNFMVLFLFSASFSCSTNYRRKLLI